MLRARVYYEIRTFLCTDAVRIVSNNAACRPRPTSHHYHGLPGVVGTIKIFLSADTVVDYYRGNSVSAVFCYYYYYYYFGYPTALLGVRGGTQTDWPSVIYTLFTENLYVYERIINFPGAYYKRTPGPAAVTRVRTCVLHCRRRAAGAPPPLYTDGVAAASGAIDFRTASVYL